MVYKILAYPMYIFEASIHTNSREKRRLVMEEARKKLRICLFFVVMAAVVIGLIYYASTLRAEDKFTDGTLVKIEKDLFYE